MADYYEILERLNYGSEQWQALSRLLREIMDSVTGHDHDGTDSPGASLAGAGLTATAAEINQVADGVGVNTTAANLNSLTGGGDIARAAGGHGHLLAAGGSDVTASAAEVNSTCDGNTASAAEITQVCDGAGATATAANLTSLTDGSNADSLHDHAYPNDVAFFDPDTATSGALLTRYTCPDRTVNFAANFSGSKATASAAATAQAIYSIQKNGVEVGTITFAAAATEGTFVSTGGAAVQLTGTTPDVLTVVAPAYADATLADVSVTLKGSI